MVPLLNKKIFHGDSNMNQKLLILLSFVFLIGITNAFADTAKEQFYLKVNSVPNVLFTSGSGFYDEGTVVTLDKIPEVWQDYKLLGLKVDGIWSNQNPLSITMNRGHEVEAIFDKQEGIGKIQIDAIPRLSEITVDGTIYLSDELPLSFDWAEGTEHTVTLSDVVKQAPNTRYKFDSWKDQNEDVIRTITVGKDNAKYIAIYKLQHYLRPITEIGTVLGGGWQDEGSTASFQIESETVPDKNDENVRYVFDSWDAGNYLNSASNLIDVEDPITVKAKWDKQYKLDIKTSVPDYNIFGTGWYGENHIVALIAEESLESTNGDVQYVFDKWVSKGPNPVIIPNAQSPITSIEVFEPYIIEAQYKNSYKVNVWTPYGSPIGSGFYPEGQIAEIKISQNEVEVEPNKVKEVFSGWDAHGAKVMDFSQTEQTAGQDSIPNAQNLLILVDSPVNVTANWKTQYYLDVQSADGAVDGSGWYDYGRLVPVSAKIPSKPPGMWSAMSFGGWTGDYDGDSPNGRVIMNAPKTVIAEWKEDGTPGVFNALILAGVGGIAVLIYSKTRNGKLPSINGKLPSIRGKKQIPINDEDSFDKFFNTRSRSSENNQPSTLIPSKSKGITKIIDWLFGR
jgi:hypothetical protein